MIRLNEPESHTQNSLFDPAEIQQLSYWHSQLSPALLRRLEESWAGAFRRGILGALKAPVGRLAQHFSPDLGAPTKELYSMAGLLLIASFRDRTGDQAVEDYNFDISVRYALNLPNMKEGMCERTFDNYMKLAREDEGIAAEAFRNVLSTLIAQLQIKTSQQRADSTHLLSDMAIFGRTQLMATTVKRFLTNLKRHHLAEYDALPEALRSAYDVPQARLFGYASKDATQRQAAKQAVANDMLTLIEHFSEHERIREQTSFKSLRRVFDEQCAVVERKATVRHKGQGPDGSSNTTLQNPSDPDAGFSGHKGTGYQVQLSQTCHSDNPIQLITSCEPQSAHEQDSTSLPSIITALEQAGAKPSQLIADTAYGSDENERHAATHGIQLISPVPGRKPKPQAAREQPTEPTNAPENAKKRGRKKQPPEPSHAESPEPPMSEGKKARLAARRASEATPEWQSLYRRRAGIESLNHSLDLVTGYKRLRVRGMKAVKHALRSKACGWNIMQAAQHLAKMARKARKAARAAAKEAPLASLWRHIDAFLTGGLTLPTARRLFCQLTPRLAA